jgi:hypothetical protein
MNVTGASSKLGLSGLSLYRIEPVKAKPNYHLLFSFHLHPHLLPIGC